MGSGDCIVSQDSNHAKHVSVRWCEACGSKASASHGQFELEHYLHVLNIEKFLSSELLVSSCIADPNN